MLKMNNNKASNNNNNNNNSKTALITGASAGIGKSFATHYAQQGWNLVITARRLPLMEALAKDLEDRFGVQVVVIAGDMSDPKTPQLLYDEIQSRGIRIEALVNNAGYGVPGNYVVTDWKQQQDFIQVLVTAVSHLCHLFLPDMIEQRYGRIINVSSINGLLPCSPGQSLYAGAKSFVVGLSHTLYVEAGEFGVNVCALCPGFTYTEFHDVTGTRDMVSRLPKSQWLDSDTVARLGYEAVERGDILCVTGRSSKIAAFMTRVLPRRTMISVMKKQSKTIRKTG